jgi:endonuclease YncB( thermonuclease family)
VLVTQVDDGDTITLADDTQVRYLGVDTPESGEPLATEAHEENRRIVEGKRVGIHRGGPDATDRYGRLLALVYAPPAREGGERMLVNAALLRLGLAWVYVAGPEAVEPRFLRLLLEAQRQAIDGRKGVWGLWLRAGGPGERELVATRFRIHLSDCEEVRGKARRPIVSLSSELRAGKSFCRSCRPQAR